MAETTVPNLGSKTNDFEPRTAILALDLGTTTGWALQGTDATIDSGAVEFRPGRFDGGGVRFLRFKAWLTNIQELSRGIALVAFEEVRRHVGVDAAHAYGGWLATLSAWCEARRIPYTGIPVGTIKRHATGKGNASKADVIIAMRAKGHAPADDNEADALAILYCALAQRLGAH